MCPGGLRPWRIPHPIRAAGIPAADPQLELRGLPDPGFLIQGFLIQCRRRISSGDGGGGSERPETTSREPSREPKASDVGEGTSCASSGVRGDVGTGICRARRNSMNAYAMTTTTT